MITKSSLLHIRLPLSFFLLPVYLLALVSAGPIDPVKAWMVFFALHFLLYTASNGFNSWCDRDTESIGTLKRPPPVTPDLLWLSLGLDLAALIVAWQVGPVFFWGCFIYGLASKAYSWNRTRIKKYPVIGWLFTGMGQGTLTFFLVMVSAGAVSLPDLLLFRFWFPGFAAGLFVLGFYPLTQIYQHAEDSRRSDITMSLALGIRRTFWLAAVFMALSLLIFCYYFTIRSGAWSAFFFIIAIAPAGIYFLSWFFRGMRDPGIVDYSHAMRICVLMSGGMNVFLALTLLVKT